MSKAAVSTYSFGSDRGAAIVELTISFLLLFVVLASLGFYVPSYLKVDEGTLAAQALSLSRFDVIPPMLAVASDGHITTDQDLGQKMQLFLRGSFTSRIPGKRGKDNCEIFGFRSIIAHLSNEPLPTGANVEYVGNGSWDCKGNLHSLADEPLAPKVIGSVTRYMPGLNLSRTVVLVFSILRPDLPAVAVEVSRGVYIANPFGYGGYGGYGGSGGSGGGVPGGAPPGPGGSGGSGGVGGYGSGY